MRVKDIRETHGDYYKSSLLISTISCDWKCEDEGLCPHGACQNSEIFNKKTIDLPNSAIIEMFSSNIFTEALIFAGLEPMLQIEELCEFMIDFRKSSTKDVVIYTGYYPSEIECEIRKLKEFKNIIVKFGRFDQSLSPRFDSVLGIELATSNQFARRI